MEKSFSPFRLILKLGKGITEQKLLRRRSWMKESTLSCGMKLMYGITCLTNGSVLAKMV